MEFDYHLLAKYITEELNPQELEEVIQWKNINAQNEEMYQRVLQLRIQQKYSMYNNPEKVTEALAAVYEKIDRRSVRYVLKSLVKYVAIVVFVFSVIALAMVYKNKERLYTSIVVKDGEGVKKHVLDDGTIVWINSASMIRIPESFSENKRNIEVEGEVYFDVKKNEGIPFVVSTKYVNIKCTGTSFNVNTIRTQGQVEAVLVSGKIALQNKKGETVLDMSPGEKVTFISGKNEYYVETTDANVSTAWHLDQLKFESITLREIVNKIAVLYSVNINLESKILADKKFRCVINREESLIDVLELLKYIIGFDYRIDGDEVFISE